MTSDEISDTSSRKDDHIKICLEEDVLYENLTTGFDNIKLEPSILVEVLPENVNLSSSIVGKKIDFPIIISSMTGGSEKSKKYNEIIGEVCNELNIGMGVGSQRAAIENPDLAHTYNIRYLAEDIPLFANLGIAQFIKGYGIKEAVEAVEMIEADGLFIHLNPLQEFVQKEGDKNLIESRIKLVEIIKDFRTPIIIKGVGSGISEQDANFFAKQDIYAIDVSGAGGTNWIKIEKYRNPAYKNLSSKFINWGIPTALSLLNVVEATKNTKIKTISSGGVWNGIDAIKSLLLGADYVAFALPVLKAIAKGGVEELMNFINSYVFEMKTVMAMIGIKNLKEMKKIRQDIIFRDFK
ncbi:MAG: type 2 isopentenyl-diphosphate Delta-isomerase [Candidatus Thorarchaeota archaeon]